MRTVADAMSTPPVTVQPATTIQAASMAMLDAGAHAALVVDDGRVCGLVTADDVARALAAGHDPSETAVGAIADQDPPLVSPDDRLAEAHERMRAAGRDVVAVTGRHREPIGLLIDPEART
jgi:CBS domain-containing protein